MSNKDTTGYFGSGTGSSASGTSKSTNGSSSEYWSGKDGCCVNNGVTCEVSSCIHHCEGQKCNADVIHVGNISANTSYDTRCDTYEEKKY